MNAMTRVGYCQECEKWHRPSRGQLFIFLNNFTGEAEARELKKTIAGISPHLYTLIQIKGNKVYYKMLCSVEGCGAYKARSENKIVLRFNETKFSEIKTMTLKNWNELVNFNDLCDE